MREQIVVGPTASVDAPGADLCTRVGLVLYSTLAVLFAQAALIGVRTQQTPVTLSVPNGVSPYDLVPLVASLTDTEARLAYGIISAGCAWRAFGGRLLAGALIVYVASVVLFGLRFPVPGPDACAARYVAFAAILVSGNPAEFGKLHVQSCAAFLGAMMLLLLRNASIYLLVPWICGVAAVIGAQSTAAKYFAGAVAGALGLWLCAQQNAGTVVCAWLGVHVLLCTARHGVADDRVDWRVVLGWLATAIVLVELAFGASAAGLGLGAKRLLHSVGLIPLVW